MRSYKRQPHVARQHLPPSQIEEFSRLQQHVRSRSAFYLDSEFKDRFGQLRARLAPEEQSILTLRLDRGLSWREIASIILEEEEQPNAEAVERESARVRKVFNRTKEKLRAMAVQEGLVPSGD